MKYLQCTKNGVSRPIWYPYVYFSKLCPSAPKWVYDFFIFATVEIWLLLLFDYYCNSTLVLVPILIRWTILSINIIEMLNLLHKYRKKFLCTVNNFKPISLSSICCFCFSENVCISFSCCCVISVAYSTCIHYYTFFLLL